MSKHEWKPGDVGVATTGERFIVTREHRCAWVTLRGDVVSGEPSPDDRPLVVIDPEDEASVGSIIDLIWPKDDPSNRPATWRIQDRLREFANPTPLKPDEPTGLGAVVEDDRGVLWTRYDLNPESAYHWISAGGEEDAYADISAVRVLSEGVS